MKHIISIDDFTYQQIYDEILPGAKKWIKFANSRGRNFNFIPKDEIKIFHFMRLMQLRVRLLFDEESTRTAESFIEAAKLLNFDVRATLGTNNNSMAKGETLLNTARTLCDISKPDAMAIRTSFEGGTRFLAEMFEKEMMLGIPYRNVSFINGGDGGNQHPTQTGLDLLTIENRLGRLDDFTIGVIGDVRYARTVQSLLKALAMRKGIKVVIVSPGETSIQPYFKTLPFVEFHEASSIKALLDFKCDFIYNSRFQKARHEGMDAVRYERMVSDIRITSDIVEGLPNHAFIMDPQPLDSRDQQITSDVRLHPKIILHEQVGMGVPMRLYLWYQVVMNKNKIELIKEEKSGSLRIVKNITIDQYWKEREKKEKSKRYFEPIKQGTVIDNIPIDLIKPVNCFLRPENMEIGFGVKHIVEDINRDFPILSKGIILIDGDYISERTMKEILSLDPRIRCNIIRDNIFTKVEINEVSPISGIGDCPNKKCITNVDSEAKAKFHIQKNGNIKCHYCEQYFRTEEIF